MNSLIVYDSEYGNTEDIAQTIGKSISGKVLKVTDANFLSLKNIDLLIIGSPTQGGRPTMPIQHFLNQIPPNGLKNVKAAAFDTRLSETKLNFLFKMLLKTIGYASPKITEILINKGANLTTPPQGFIVEGKEGPLASGEIERAKKWIK